MYAMHHLLKFSLLIACCLFATACERDYNDDTYYETAPYIDSEKESWKALNDYTGEFADGSKLAVGYSELEGTNDEYPLGTGLIRADFMVVDTENNYISGFQCHLEKLINNEWCVVEPLGPLVQANNGFGEFYKETQTGRKSINLDLAWYPLQEAGTYRIVKPFFNRATKEAYETYYEFKLVDKEPSRQPIKGELTLEKNTYEPDPILTIKYFYEDPFGVSNVFDIEYNDNGNWVSTFNGDIEANSTRHPYTLYLKDTMNLNTLRYNLIKEGNYRIRFSVCLLNLDNDSGLMTDYFETWYVPFTIKEKRQPLPTRLPRP